MLENASQSIACNFDTSQRPLEHPIAGVLYRNVWLVLYMRHGSKRDSDMRHAHFFDEVDLHVYSVEGIVSQYLKDQHN